MTNEILIKKIEKIYECFGKPKTRYSILVDGVWGIGKTFAYNKFINGKKNNNYYISLFGVSSLKEIENEIIQKVLFPTFKKLNKSSIIHVLSKIGFKYIENKSGINFSDINFSDIINANKIENLDFSNKSLICFDDIERVNQKIDFKELLGLIERLSKKTNVLILCNKSKLSLENLNIFNEYQEKTIDYYYYLDKLDNEFLETFISGWSVSEESVIALKNFFIENGNQNLRFLEKIKILYEEIKIEYGESEWIFEYQTSILIAISYLVLEQFYGKLTEKYKKNEIYLRKQINPKNSEDSIIKNLEKEINDYSYFEGIPYEFREIAMLLNKFIRYDTDINQEMIDYFCHKETFNEISEKIGYWFLEDENSIKKSYPTFKEKFIKNIEIFNINYQLRGFLVLRRFQNTFSNHDDLFDIKIQLKKEIKQYLGRQKHLDINREFNNHTIDTNELEILEEIKNQAEKELQEEKINIIKENILKLDFKSISSNKEEGSFISDLEQLKDFFHKVLYVECPKEYWENFIFIFKLLTHEAKKKLTIKIDENISTNNSNIIKNRNEFLKNIISNSK
ncbi:MAG: hypothetical protein ACRC6U_10905 [Fusobacteriaceae bacterium]